MLAGLEKPTKGEVIIEGHHMELSLIHIFGKDAKARAYKLVNEIRSHGVIVETDYMDRSVKAQMKYANKIGAKKTVIIGSEELENNLAHVKDMETGEQVEVALSLIHISSPGTGLQHLEKRTATSSMPRTTMPLLDLTM